MTLLVVGAPAYAGSDPDRQWITLESAHFAVHTYDGGEEMARRVAAARGAAREITARP